jgi:2-iminobutanoate/2-iminopropanoate deaminase
MERKVIGRKTDTGTSTLAVEAGGLIFTTGQIGTDKESGELPPEVEEQTTNTLETLRRVIEQAGSSLGNVVKVNVYLDEIDAEFDRMNAAYAAYFKEHGVEQPPARTTIGCRLPWSKVEMDMVALA